jgi:hypothetical protein
MVNALPPKWFVGETVIRWRYDEKKSWFSKIFLTEASVLIAVPGFGPVHRRRAVEASRLPSEEWSIQLPSVKVP